jgi:predicted Zn-dependent protease
MILIDTPTEVSMGEGLHRKLTGQLKLSSQELKVQRLRRIGQKVAAVSDRRDYEYHFFLVEKDEMNAFTIPGGYIYMFSGLLDKLTSDDQVAFVLAHEVGHCAARHTVKKFQAALGYDLIGGLVLSRVGGEQARQLASMSSDVMMRLVFSAYGRGDEFEADRLGVKYLKSAGYDPGASVAALEALRKESRDAGGAPLVLRSHPYISDRIKAVQEEVQRP